MKNKFFSAIFAVVLAAGCFFVMPQAVSAETGNEEEPAQLYNLSTESYYGDISFAVDGKKVTQAAEGDTVTLEVTPEAGYEGVAYYYYKTADKNDYTSAADIEDMSFRMPAYDITVVAQYEPQNFLINGKAVTAANKSDILGDDENIKGKASYNAAANTLTLTNLQLKFDKSSYTFNRDPEGAKETFGIYSDKAINIVIEGDCIIEGFDIGIGIDDTDGIENNISISGPGTLTLKGYSNSSTYGMYLDAEEMENIDISCGKLHIYNYGVGVYTDDADEFNVTADEIIVRGDNVSEEYMQHAFYTNVESTVFRDCGRIYISRAGYGIDNEGTNGRKQITFENCPDVRISVVNRGIYVDKSVNFYNSNVEITSEEDSAIYSNKGIVIADSDILVNGGTSSYSDCYGIHLDAEYDTAILDITDSNVCVSGGTAAIEYDRENGSFEANTDSDLYGTEDCGRFIYYWMRPVSCDSPSDDSVINIADAKSIRVTTLRIDPIGDKVYNGSEICPTLHVTYAGTNLREGTDYTVTFENNINAGEAIAHVHVDYKEIGFKCDKDITFNIVPSSIKSVQLSAASFKYNGTVRKPAVTVKNVNGVIAQSVKASTDDVKITYAQGRKNVGKYKVTIEGCGNYCGKITKTFKINPKGATIRLPRSTKNSVTVRWYPQKQKMAASTIAGYQVQLATNKAFTKGKKTSYVKGYLNSSKEFKKLKSKTGYYVRVRTCKNGCYSAWSNAKYIKTKTK